MRDDYIGRYSWESGTLGESTEPEFKPWEYCVFVR